MASLAMNENLGKKIVSLSLQILFTTVYGKERPFNRDLEYGKEIQIVSETKEKLLVFLNETEKELLQALSDAHGNMSRIVIADSFVDGFCLGMRISIEVMQKEY